MPAEALQRKIKTTQELREIVGNMKTLSSVSILQYEQANTVLEKYQHNLRDAIHILAMHNGIPQFISANFRNPRYLIIIIGSDNGMVGRFNREIIEYVQSFIKTRKIAADSSCFITIGKRLSQLAEQADLRLIAGYATSNSVKAVISLAETIIMRIEQAMRSQRITDIYICYHRRGNAGNTAVEMKKILPVDADSLLKLKNKKWDTNNIPMMPVDKSKMFAALVGEIMMIALAKQINSSLAAEHFIRMTNMQNAEKNIDENLATMNLEFQQQRQDEITGELIDVVSGANAMNEKNNNKKPI
ncbi:MAG: F0F1 ATP synthase subunit gamma [Alphaproteobacteria bacterium]|nr:F0F1 ATP synthase subunit gamma [Alphaproteobacteria bacterium]